IVLKLPDTFSVEILRDHVKALEGAVADVLGAALKVRFKTEGTAKNAGPPSVAAPVTAEESLEDVDALFNYANERIPER
ncbi:MAG: hypothetical protein ABI282_03070, partial [Candidatus Baltobacteraceae bacterium]